MTPAFVKAAPSIALALKALDKAISDAAVATALRGLRRVLSASGVSMDEVADKIVSGTAPARACRNPSGKPQSYYEASYRCLEGAMAGAELQFITNCIWELADGSEPEPARAARIRSIYGRIFPSV